MSNTGTHDKASNYVKMRDIDAAGKKIIVILNDKQGDLMSDEEIDANENLRAISAKVRRNIHDLGIRQDCKIEFVNADMAKDARELVDDPEGAAYLVKKSRIENLKKLILSELKKSDSFSVLRNALFEIDRSLAVIIEELSQGEQSKAIQDINDVLNMLREQKVNLRKDMQSYIERKASRLAKNLPDMIWQNKDNQEKINSLIQQEIESLASAAQRQMESQIKEVNELLDNKISLLVENMSRLSVDVNRNISVNCTDVEMVAGSTVEGKRFSEDDMNNLANAGKQLWDIYQKSQMAFNVKDLVVYAAPNVVSQVGGKAATAMASKAVSSVIGPTVGKLLGTKLAAFIPYVGPIITIATTVLPFLFGDNGAEERARAQVEAENEYNRRKMEAEIQARQELNQKCENMAEDIAEELVLGVRNAVDEIIGGLEKCFVEELNRNKNIMNERSEDIAELREISNEFNLLAMKLGVVE